jgi:uncharacterized protein
VSQTDLPWLRTAGDDVVLNLHIQPGARKTEVVGLHGDALKIRLNAPPVDGKANDCLIAFIADRLGVPKARVILESGQTSRAKRVRIADAGQAGNVAAVMVGRSQ